MIEQPMSAKHATVRFTLGSLTKAKGGQVIHAGQMEQGGRGLMRIIGGSVGIARSAVVRTRTDSSDQPATLEQFGSESRSPERRERNALLSSCADSAVRIRD
jgi:hypothetical protein